MPLERFLHILRADDLDHAPEFEDPGEEGRAHRDFGIELEVILVHGGGFHLAAEVVDDRVHGAVVAEEGHGLVIRIEHAESLFGKGSDAVAFWFLHRGFFQEFRGIRDAVHTEDGDLFMLFGPADDIVEITVPGQGIGAEDIGLSPVLQLPTLGAAVLEVAEADLHAGIDGRVQRVQDLIAGFVLGFHPVGEADVALQIPGVVDGGQGGELFGQDAALLPGDELPGFHRVDQQLQLRKAEEALPDIVTILGGADHRDRITGGDHGLDVLLDRDPIRIEVPALLQLTDDLDNRDRMLRVGLGLQNLQNSQDPGTGFENHKRPSLDRMYSIPNLILYYITGHW